MAKRPHKAPTEEIELRPDGWQQFERAIGTLAKVGPKHRKPKGHVPKRQTKNKSKGLVGRDPF